MAVAVKRSVLSVMNSVLICIAGFYLNDWYYHKADKLLLCIRQQDGKWVTEYGFGFKVYRIIDEVRGNSCTNVGSMPNMLLTFAAISVLTYLAIYLYSKVKGKTVK